MNKVKQIFNSFNFKKHDYIFMFILVVGVLVRVISFSVTPAGFNQDEAFAAYQTLSLLRDGVDSMGYGFPVYFTAWGSGMNALESYLALPFFAIFGPSVAAFRTPQLLLSIISLVIFYLLLKKMFTIKVALIGVGILTVSPWHIMLSRWGLESNLAPAFLLLGLYFFVLGIEKNKYWIVSSIMYGLALYTYAPTWLVVPFVIIFCVVYLLIMRKKILLRYALPSVGILALFGIPLILFLFINNGLMNEISTSFFSIPKLVDMREGELSLTNLLNPDSYYNFFNILITQNDGLPWNSTEDFGMFYLISFPFIVFGMVIVVMNAWKKICNKEFSYEVIVLVCAFVSFIACLMIQNLNINKANSFHIYTAIFLALGLNELFTIFKNYQIVSKGVLATYGIMFVFFTSYYFGQYNDLIGYYFNVGAGDAIKFAKEQEHDSIYIDYRISYSVVLFYDETPQQEYEETVQYYNYPSTFLGVSSFGNYKFTSSFSYLDVNSVYIADQVHRSNFTSFEIQQFGMFIVAYNGS